MFVALRLDGLVADAVNHFLEFFSFALPLQVLLKDASVIDLRYLLSIRIIV